MANIRGEVQIEADGKSYLLVYNFMASVRLEEYLLPEELHQVFARWNDKVFRQKDILGLLWAGMRQHHPMMTADQCAGLIDAVGPNALMNQMLEAMALANNPNNEPGTTEGNATADVGIGTTSSRPPLPMG